MERWTKEQKNAIEARNSNLLVAAAAGSGKTAVLVERIIQLIIKDGINIDKLLIVTFTNAAAGEMRERINLALLEEVEKSDNNKEHLRKQVNMLSRSSISTLHSFCIDVVRRYFHLINIDPKFRIGDMTEISILKMEVLEEIFEEAYKLQDKDFISLIERFGGNKEDVPLQDLVLKIYEFIQSKPYPLEWMREKVADFGLDLENYEKHPWFLEIQSDIKIQLTAAMDLLNEAMKLCRLPGASKGYIEVIGDDIRILSHLSLMAVKGLHDLYNELTELKYKRFSKMTSDADEGLVEKIKELRQEAKDIIKNIKDELFTKSPKDYIKDLNELHPCMEYLFRLVSEFEACYREKKMDKGIVDFNDLEHYALKILANEEVAQEYKKKYDYIFVDEYQDSNIVQETILSFIKKENNLFMVGDVKQSIYRFRLADPSLFIEKYLRYGESLGEIDRRINLSKNFRSRDEVIHGVNFIFKNLMSKSFGEIDYDENAFLYKGADSKPITDPAIEINIIEKINETDETMEELIDMEAEARLAVQTVKNLVDTEFYDSKLMVYRQITYRDIAILMRTTKNWAQCFLDAFMGEGIPAYADVNTGYFETIEISIFMNLLSLIDNKRQDIPLLSVMRSPLGGFSTEEFIKIRTHSNKNTFCDAMMEFASDGEEGLKGKLMEFLHRLDGWKEKSRYMEMDEFIWRLLIDTGYYYYIGAMPGGQQRQGNLRVLVDRSRQFQRTSIRGLFNFIKFIDKLKMSSGDMGTAKTLGENENVVRIMSIHKSKGLEFPAVIVAGLGKQFNLSDINAQVLFHKDLGIGPKYVDPDLRQYTDTVAKIAMKNKIKLETLAEEMRILYVALTRAKERLILIGSYRDLQKAGEKWAKPLNVYYLSKGKNFLDWLCAILLRHRDAEPLREITGINMHDAELLEDESKWVIKCHKKANIIKSEIIKNLTKDSFKELLENYRNADPNSKIFQRLSWEYAHVEATRIPSKLSVTDIKRLSEKRLDDMVLNIPKLIKRPKFIEGKKQISPMERGIIIHFAMQHLALNDVDSLEAIENQINRLVDREFLNKEEAQYVDVQKILNFFHSTIGKRIRCGKKVYREVPFNLTRNAKDIVPDIVDCEDGVLIQGIIDCYFEEEDGYVLVDYKTDYVSSERKADLIERYRIQIDLYKQALECITGKRVKESFIYLFHLDEEVKL